MHDAIFTAMLVIFAVGSLLMVVRPRDAARFIQKQATLASTRRLADPANFELLARNTRPLGIFFLLILGAMAALSWLGHVVGR